MRLARAAARRFEDPEVVRAARAALRALAAALVVQEAEILLPLPTEGDELVLYPPELLADT